MKAVQTFQQRFLKNTTEVKSPLKTISIFQGKNDIYFLSNGLIKKEVKSKIETLYSKSPLEKVFVSLLPNREYLRDANEDIVLDTYVWFSSEPEHTIHYSSSPNIKPRKNRILL